ncbi:hypothetical protein BV25DRAFT_1921836 [Artomyces pyxidatus]|uniref:Uncharacterized protein n=1 Tax=Artomyces pyxidatus TaxID=48021 RepID=A0ACB8SI64_9AGAM|nr:hypothetical protein BV25DRAFT_1921836 [Artomyces pyxidatus]
MAPVLNGIFTSATPGESIATLVLIENSSAMVSRWPDLRDRHLPTLLGTMRIENPISPINVLWLMSCPANEATTSSTPDHGSRQSNQLPEVWFNAQPSNRISPWTIYHGAQLLASTFPDLPTSRHLIVIAASAPSENGDKIPGVSGAETDDPWLPLRTKLYQEDIHLHMILNPRDKADSFIKLFDDLLNLQNCKQAMTWFPVDLTNYKFYLSTRQRKQTSGASNLPMMSQYSEEHQFQPPPHPPPSHACLPRNHSSGAPFRSPTIPKSQEAPRPSLIKRLQKVHGLTRKTYCLQLSRQPFIRDERLDPALSETVTQPEEYSPGPGMLPPLLTRPLTTRALRRTSGVNASRKIVEEPRRSSVQVNSTIIASFPDSDFSTLASPLTSVSPINAIERITHVPMSMSLEALPTNSRAGTRVDKVHATLLPADAWAETTYPPAPTNASVSPPLWNSDEASHIAQGNYDLPTSDTFQIPWPQYSDSISPPPSLPLASEIPLLLPKYTDVQPPGQSNHTSGYSFQQGGIGAVASSPVVEAFGAPTLPSDLEDLERPFIFPDYEENVLTPLPGPTPLSPQSQSFLAMSNCQLPPALPHLMTRTPSSTVYLSSNQPTPPPPLRARMQSSGGADYSHLLNSAVAPDHLRSNSRTSAPTYDNSVSSSEHTSSLSNWAGC